MGGGRIVDDAPGRAAERAERLASAREIQSRAARERKGSVRGKSIVTANTEPLAVQILLDSQAIGLA